MNRQTSVSCVRKHAPRLRPLLGAASWLWLAASPLLRASESVVEIGPAVARSRVPRWDARGLGPLPWQGIACLDSSEDGRFLAIGTICVLDANGKKLWHTDLNKAAQPGDFIAQGIEAGEATGWSRMTPPKPNPLCRFAQTNYAVAAWLEPILSAAYGDFDGDGRPDVAVLVPKGRGSAVKIYRNQGGKFTDSPDAVVELPELSRGWKLRMVRLGGGNVADFFVSSESQAVLLLAQQGQLKFKVLPLPVIRGARVAGGDFDVDGRTDLVIGSRFVSGYYVASQRANGTFEVRQTKAPTETYFDLELTDVNGDKREDLVVSSGDVFLRQPDGSLALAPTFHLKPPAGVPQGWAFMAAADFDRDGRTDVALLANGKDGTTVWLYRNTQSAQEPFPKEPSAKFVVPDTSVNRDGPTVADFNGDGVADLILCTRDKQPGVRILAGSPADGLSPQRIVSVKLDYVPHFDTRFGVADYNGDGRLDLAGFGRSPTGAVGVYIWLQPESGAK